MNENNKYKLKLKELVSGSSLDEKQKGLWELFIKVSKPEEDEAVFEAASEDDESLRLLTRHLADKIRDMNEKSKGLLQKLAWG